MTRWQRFKCMINLHDWPKWELVRYEMYSVIARKDFVEDRQKRVCKLCGRIQETKL